MQTLRKKNSPCKFKNEPTRFLGEGVSFKAKLIGILEVSEARGDRMCQAALADLKMAIRAAGEHKQRIAVQVSIDGLRLRDEKTGECLYHHPVHKISFISQDMSDSRAFGYIFGSPDTGHRFFGIKTDKAASQVVIAIRELFQVVFELKKKEIELAKQHIEQNAINEVKFHTGGIFVEPAPDTKGAAGSESSLHRIRTSTTEPEKPAERKPDNQGGVIADLLDLQFELNSLQQGIHQMDKINPENPPSSGDDLFEADPFGDSFANMKLKETVQPILPPPPSSSKRGHLERQQTVPASAQTTSSTSSPGAAAPTSKTPPPQSSVHWFDKETENLFEENELASLPKPKKEPDEATTQAKSPQIDVFTELDPLGTGLIKPYVDKKDFFQHLKNPPKKVLKDLVSTSSTDTFPTNFHLVPDPLEAAKPADLITKEPNFEDANFANFDKFDENEATQSFLAKSDSPQRKEAKQPAAPHHQPFSVSLPPEEANASTTSGPVRPEKESADPVHGLVKLPSPKKYGQSARKKDFDPEVRAPSLEKPFPVDFSAASATESPGSPLRSCSSDANSRLSSSSAELELVPEPPPRGAGSVLINPPPLPPKKQAARGPVKPPPRPPHSDGQSFHYDFPERDRASPSPTRSRKRSPLREARSQFDDNFSPPVPVPGPGQTQPTASRADPIRSMTASAFEDSFSQMIVHQPSTNFGSFFSATRAPTTASGSASSGSKKPKPSLDITLSQLTSSNLDELASSLGMTAQELTSLTLQQLTECLARLSSRESTNEVEEPPQKVEEAPAKHQVPVTLSQPSGQPTDFVSTEPLFKTNFEEPKQDATYDKYAVFRELLELEQMEQQEQKNQTEDDESKLEEIAEDEVTMEEERDEDQEATLEARTESASDSIASLVNLTVKLPPADEPMKEETIATGLRPVAGTDAGSGIAIGTGATAATESGLEPAGASEEFDDTFSSATMELDQMTEPEEKEKSTVIEGEPPGTQVQESSEAEPEEELMDKAQPEPEEAKEPSEMDSDINETPERLVDGTTEENGSATLEKAEVKSSASTSSDRYAALREIIGDPEPKREEEAPSVSARASPVVQPPSQPKSLADVELLSLFSDSLPAPTSPKKQGTKDEDLKTVAMDIFEEIKMLNTGTHRAKESKSAASGFEDVFCPFTETRQDRDESKDDGNWAKFDTGIFGSSSCEGPRSVGGTSPWSPDGKEFHRDSSSYKGSVHRHSGDSDNEWKDEEESEESNGRTRGEAGRFWCGRHPRYEGPGFDERSFYEDGPAGPSEKRDRGFRGRMTRKSRGAPWSKSSHRPRDASPWQGCQGEGPWEDEPRRYPPQRKMPYKDEENQYEPHWKCRPKCRNWGYDYAGFHEDDRFAPDRFGSQESMGYDGDDRWNRGKYDRRRWEEDARFWSRRPGPPDPDYPMRETYYYYRESREWPHDYPPGWDEEYGPERPGDDSPRYTPGTRKISWPKRPNSANEGRNAELNAEPRGKFGASRSECSDDASDPYLRPSQRSRSRESYWGSDQEDSWPETYSLALALESIYRKRIEWFSKMASQGKTQSPFEDDFAQSIEHVESPATDSMTQEPRIRPDIGEGKRDLPPPPSSPSRCPKDRRDLGPPVRDYPKRSSFFEDELTPTASGSSGASDRPRVTDLKPTPEEAPKDGHQPVDGFEEGRDTFFNGDLRYDDDDAFAFKAEMDDSMPEQRATTLPLKGSRQAKYGPGGGSGSGSASASGSGTGAVGANTGKARGDQFIRKSESVNIFVRENDPFDDDDFFN